MFTKFSKRKKDTSLDDLVSKGLTEHQKTILENRINYDVINEFELSSLDIINSKFDPIKGLNKLTDVYEAGKFLAKAMSEGKNIAIVNDFDADGINSASVGEVAFRDIFKYKNYKSVINRRRTGRGFSKTLTNRVIELHKEWPIDIMITADHGSSDEASYKKIKEAGVKHIIVTDHHELPDEKEKVPRCVDFFVNPMKPNSKYYKEISGCFVLYLLMLTTHKNLKKKWRVEDLDKLLPYVAFSTISDVMSLSLPINRQVVKLGLREMNKFNNLPWLIIKKLLKIENTISYQDIGYKLAPLVNTGNRVDQEELAFKLLTGTDFEETITVGKKLLSLNLERKEVTKTVSKQIRKELEDVELGNTIVLTIDTEYAINGIVASNIGESYYKPTVCFIADHGNKDIIAGSGRGVIEGLNLHEVYTKIANETEFVMGHGGHKLAAGITIKKEGFDKFKELFEKYVSEYEVSKSEKRLEYDIKLPSSDINPFIVKELNRLAPYGKNWNNPVYCSRLKVFSVMLFGNIAKVKFVTNNNEYIEAMHYFKTKSNVVSSNIRELVKSGEIVEVLYTLNISTFNGTVNLDMVIEDIDVGVTNE